MEKPPKLFPFIEFMGSRAHKVQQHQQHHEKRRMSHVYPGTHDTGLWCVDVTRKVDALHFIDTAYSDMCSTIEFGGQQYYIPEGLLAVPPDSRQDEFVLHGEDTRQEMVDTKDGIRGSGSVSVSARGASVGESLSQEQEESKLFGPGAAFCEIYCRKDMCSIVMDMTGKTPPHGMIIGITFQMEMSRDVALIGEANGVGSGKSAQESAEVSQSWTGGVGSLHGQGDVQTCATKSIGGCRVIGNSPHTANIMSQSVKGCLAQTKCDWITACEAAECMTIKDILVSGHVFPQDDVTQISKESRGDEIWRGDTIKRKAQDFTRDLLPKIKVEESTPRTLAKVSRSSSCPCGR